MNKFAIILNIFIFSIYCSIYSNNFTPEITEAKFILMNRQKTLNNIKQRLKINDTLSKTASQNFSKILNEIDFLINTIESDIVNIDTEENVYKLVDKSNLIIDKIDYQIKAILVCIEITKNKKFINNLQTYLNKNKRLEDEIVCKIKSQIQAHKDNIISLNQQLLELSIKLKQISLNNLLPKIQNIKQDWFINSLNIYKKKL